MTDPVIIREPVEDDLDALVEMLFQMDAHVSGAPREALQMTSAGDAGLRNRLRWLMESPGALILVAETEDGELAGMADVHVPGDDGIWETPERRDRRVGVIDDVWVDPAHRRRGITKRLLDGLLKFAEDNDVQHLMLEYSTANTEADATWRHFGFAPTGVRAAARLADVRARLDGGDGR